MKKFIFLLLIAAGISSCHHAKNVTSSGQKESEKVSSGSGGGNGQSIDEAIVINETTETEGVAAEYVWLKANYPGYSLIKQSLIEEGGKPYDKMEIKTAEGDKKTIYFDISHFFGKF
ncbi:MAG TPA: hypothetical protein VFJ43_06325 [Bacteroidia bacterium]|nr:hypothetical protein [Bacteroidia bacterium]